MNWMDYREQLGVGFNDKDKEQFFITARAFCKFYMDMEPKYVFDTLNRLIYLLGAMNDRGIKTY